MFKTLYIVVGKIKICVNRVLPYVHISLAITHIFYRYSPAAQAVLVPTNIDDLTEEKKRYVQKVTDVAEQFF